MKLKEQVADLQIKLAQLTQKYKLLNETVLFYADPLVDYDGGKVARSTIKKLSMGYKPVIGNFAVMFKEKEVYPFIEFENYIETEEEDCE